MPNQSTCKVCHHSCKVNGDGLCIFCAREKRLKKYRLMLELGLVPPQYRPIISDMADGMTAKHVANARGITERTVWRVIKCYWEVTRNADTFHDRG